MTNAPRPARLAVRFAAALLTLRAAAADPAEPPTNIVVRVEALSLAPTARPGPSLLRDVPGLALRDQGSGGPQTDLSVRGSPFNSTGLLLNGLTLRSAQTEHWHADVPAPEVWFASPAVLTGLDRFRLAPGHPSGSVSLDLAPLTEDLRSVTAGAGSRGLLFGSALATETERLANGADAGASAFLSYDRCEQTDGFSGNDLERVTAGARLGAAGRALQGDFVAATSWREFGARGFYGTSPLYPAAERVADTLAAASLQTVGDPLNPARATAAWRRTHDTYWLDRDHHDVYENDHVTDVFALHGDTRRTLSETFALDLRADGDLEALDSSSLGDHDRSRGSFAALPRAALGPLTLTLGGALELFTHDKPAWLPAAGAEWSLSDAHALFASYTEAVRQPSYTELNYESPASLGNAGLDRQHTRAAEAGWKGQADPFSWKAALFVEEGREIVDWIKTAPAGRWTAVNLDEVRTWGFAADGRAGLTADTDLGFDVLALNKSCSAARYASRYALDYPEAAAGVTLRSRLTRDLLVRVRQSASKYEPNRARGGGDWFAGASAELQWRPPRVRRVTLNAGVDNLFDDDFQVFPGQEPAGRRFFGSLAYAW